MNKAVGELGLSSQRERPPGEQLGASVMEAVLCDPNPSRGWPPMQGSGMCGCWRAPFPPNQEPSTWPSGAKYKRKAYPVVFHTLARGCRFEDQVGSFTGSS